MELFQQIILYISVYMITMSIICTVQIVMHNYSKRFEYNIQHVIVGTILPLMFNIGLMMLVVIILKMFVL